jgi:hypothetical protein
LLFADRMLWNLGTPISLLRTTFASNFPEIVVNNHDTERSGFSAIEIRQTSRHSEIWGHSETDGTSCKRSYVPRVNLYCHLHAREALTGSGPYGATVALANGRGRTKMAEGAR